MTERNLAIRLSVLDGGKVKAELTEIGDTGEKSLKRIELAGQPASRGLMALNAAANDIKSSAVGMASSLGPVGSGLIAIGPAGIAAGVAITGIVGVLKEAFSAGSQAEQAFNKMSGVLKATGNASGLTANQIADLAEGIEKSTMATSEQVLDAASVLATFRSVSGDTFKRALGFAQDMAAVFGGDASTAAKQLGKALQDPEEGITALNRVGVTFNATQKDMIKSFMDSGQVAAAQKVILDELAHEVGGSGAAERQGLAGAAKGLSDSWDDMLKSLGRSEGVAGPIEAVFKALGETLDYVRDKAQPSVGTQIEETTKQLKEAQAAVARLKGPDQDVLANQPMIEAQQKRADELQAQLKNIMDDAKKAEDAEAAAQKKADAGRLAAEHQGKLDNLAEQGKKLDDAFDKIAINPAEKIARVNKELDETKAKLNALREKDGSTDGQVDADIAKAEKLAQAQIDAINKPISDAASKAEEENRKVIDDLVKGVADVGDKRKQFIDEQLNKLNKYATEADKAEVVKNAGERFDKDQAADKLKKLQEEGLQVTEKTRDATATYAEQLRKLKELLDAGAISQDTYNAAVAKAGNEELKSRKDGLAGAQRAFADYKDQAEDSASAVETAFKSGMKSTEDAITDAVTSGGKKLSSLSDLAMSIVTDITRMLVQKTITAPLFNAISGSFADGGTMAGIFSSIFHDGGIVGAGAPQRHVPAHVFAGAPRYHTGGIAGLKADEVPAILQRGETVLPRGAGRVNQSEYNFNVSVSGPAAGDPQLAAQSGRALAQAMKASILDTIQDQQRFGGQLYR